MSSGESITMSACLSADNYASSSLISSSSSPVRSISPFGYKLKFLQFDDLLLPDYYDFRGVCSGVWGSELVPSWG